MHASDFALVAYASWTLALVFAIACLRASLTLRGKRAANAFSVTGDDVSPFSGRLCRAHANCVENLPVFAVIVIAVIMVILMTGSQFITQLQIMSKNQSAEMKASPMYRQQRVLLYLLPLVFAFSGFTFPLGVMFYWLVSNFWTMGQQFLVIRNMPTPGSEAALAREARLAKRQQRKGIVEETPDGGTLMVEEPKKPQRQQPVGKNRSKKKKK